MRRALQIAPLLLPLIAAAPACGKGTDGTTLVVAAYTTPREVFARALLPAFASARTQAGKPAITFEESYQASGAQSRAVAEGFEADVVALSLAPDVDRLVKAGLVDDTWDDDAYGGMVTRSLVVIAVRAGNPKGIRDWEDLAKDGVEVLTPNVRTSGGAMWNIAAIYGAAKRGKTGTLDADALLAEILANVTVMDKGARDSLVNFENGVGDAAITYENEVLLSKKEGKPIDYVVPTSTIQIESPATVVHAYAKKRGTTELAQAFVDFLREPASQKAFVEYGFRPVIDGVPTEGFPVVTDLFTVKDLGGWGQLDTDIFAKGAAYDRAMSKAGK
jgi:sulfate transport system substrate-binding protein